ELTAAGHGGEGFHFKPVLIELQRAAQLAEAVGQIFKRERTVLEFDAPLKTGIPQRAMGLELESGDAAGGQIGIERFSELEIDRAAGGKIELLRALERETSVRAKVGVVSGYVEGIETDTAAGQRCVQAPVALEMNARDVNRQLAKLGVAAKLLKIVERAVDGDRPGERGVGAEGFNVRHAKKRADVELRKVDASLRGVAASQFRLAF